MIGRVQNLSSTSDPQPYLVKTLKTILMSNHEIQKTTPSKNSLSLSNQPNKLIGEWIQNESEYQVALTYGEKRIGNFGREDMTNLVELMAQWRIHLGVTSDPTEQELIIICQFVYDNFKTFTLADIRLAMNWAIAGKIDLGFISQKTFSSFYVSKAINAYSDQKRHHFNTLMERREQQLRRSEIENKKELTPLEKADEFKTLIVSMYQGYRSGGIFYDFGDFIYDWLKNTKQIDQSDKSNIQAAVVYGKEKYRKEKQKNNVAVLARAVAPKKEPENQEQMEKKYAREYIIIQYFEKYSLGEIIQKIKPEQFQ